MTIIISTDGSALGNPNGPMGWAWADHMDALGDQNSHQHASHADAGGATNGTNQIGELCAVLEALRTHRGSEELVIETDSQYAINCATKWVHNWKRNGWKNSKKQPVKNADLIKAIDAELNAREGKVRFVWVKGHAGNPGNEKVDDLAHTYAGDCRSGKREGYLPREGWQSLLASEYADDNTHVPDDAQKLLDGKLSADDYRYQHAGKPEILTSAGSTEPVTTSTASTPTPAQTAQPRTPRTEDTLGIETTTPAQTTQTRTRHTSSGLNASGDILITPPPSSSPSFTGDRMYIKGTIAFEGYVDADGHLQLDGDVFLS